MPTYQEMNAQIAQARTADGDAGLTPIQKEHLARIATFIGKPLQPIAHQASGGDVRQFAVDGMPNATVMSEVDQNGATRTHLHIKTGDKTETHIIEHNPQTPCDHITTHGVMHYENGAGLYGDFKAITVINGSQVKKSPMSMSLSDEDKRFHKVTTPDRANVTQCNMASSAPAQAAEFTL